MVVWLDGDASLTAREAAARLKVKPQTLYADVSRGLPRSFRQGIRRRRLCRRREIEALAGPARPARRAGRRAHGRGASLPRAED